VRNRKSAKRFSDGLREEDGLNVTKAKTTAMLEFPDNRLMARLAGPGQKHFVRLEQKLPVRVSMRGNLVSLEGAGRETAAKVLRALYARLEVGESATLADFDAEIRFALDATAGAPGATGIRTASGKTVRARSPMQSVYLEAMAENPLVFAVGPAGTGKTFLAAAYGASLLYRRQVDRLILSRPALEAGERLGFLPGDLKEKIDPYLRPLYDALYAVIGESCNALMEKGVIEVAPLAFMRGRTLSRAFVILDEAQNCTAMQMKMFLTRLGEDSRMTVTGDPSQSDLPSGRAEGLEEALTVLEGIEGAAVVRFGEADVVRHALVSRIVAAYNAAAKG
jgi:phosphate starvation-inducible protein PhoH and related proteins